MRKYIEISNHELLDLDNGNRLVHAKLRFGSGLEIRTSDNELIARTESQNTCDVCGWPLALHDVLPNTTGTSLLCCYLWDEDPMGIAYDAVDIPAWHCCPSLQFLVPLVPLDHLDTHGAILKQASGHTYVGLNSGEIYRTLPAALEATKQSLKDHQDFIDLMQQRAEKARG